MRPESARPRVRAVRQPENVGKFSEIRSRDRRRCSSPVAVRTLNLSCRPHPPKDRNDDQQRLPSTFRQHRCALPLLGQKFPELLLNIHNYSLYGLKESNSGLSPRLQRAGRRSNLWYGTPRNHCAIERRIAVLERRGVSSWIHARLLVKPRGSPSAVLLERLARSLAAGSTNVTLACDVSQQEPRALISLPPPMTIVCQQEAKP